MTVQDKDKMITFYPSKGLGNVLFTFNEKEVEKAFGKADGVDKEEGEDTGEAVVSISYYDLGVDFFLEYFDDDFMMSIHADDVILDGMHIGSLSKVDMLEGVKKYHENNNLEFAYEHAIDEETDEDCHFFDHLGLTIWYEGEDISDIRLQDPATM